MRTLTLGLLLLPLLAMPAVAAPEAKSAASKLKKGIGSKNDDLVRESLEALLDMGGTEAANELLSLIPKMGGASDIYYWQIINSAAGFRDRAALKTVGEFIVKRQKAPYARDLVFGLENNSSHHAIAPLKMVLEGGPYDLQLMAVDQLGMIATTESVDALIGALQKEGDKGDPQLRRRIMASLSTITKENMGDALNWIGWWEANRAKGLPEPHEGPRMGGDATSTMNSDRGRELESVKKQPNRILVISSKRPKDAADAPGKDYNYDHMEGILSQMKIPHKVVLKAEFEKNPNKWLKPAWTVLINCNNIQTQCICKECSKIMNQRAAKGGSLGPKKNRLYTCPPDCPQGHKRVQFKLSDKSIKAIKKWVEKGGYLFTEDWGVVEVVERAWPKLVTSNSKKKPDAVGNPQTVINLVRQMTVPIVPGRGMVSQPLLRGVFTRPRRAARAPEGSDGDDEAGGTRVRDMDPTENPTVAVRHKWKIDDESPSIRVQNKGAVQVLMRSQELGAAAEGDEAVAVNFRVGKGKPAAAKKRKKKGPMTGGARLSGKSRGKGVWSELQRGGSVLHVISHFGKQQGSRSDTFVLQNLILNFIMESNRQHGG